MFTCSGLCHLYPFCSFLLIKVLRSPMPFRRLQRLALCFLKRKSLSSSNFNVIIADKFWATSCNISPLLNDGRYYTAVQMVFDTELWTFWLLCHISHSHCSSWKAGFVIPLNSVIWGAFSITPYQIWLPQQRACGKKKRLFAVSFHFLSPKFYQQPGFNIICPLWGGGCFLYKLDSGV